MTPPPADPGSATSDDTGDPSIAPVVNVSFGIGVPLSVVNGRGRRGLRPVSKPAPGGVCRASPQVREAMGRGAYRDGTE